MQETSRGAYVDINISPLEEAMRFLEQKQQHFRNVLAGTEPYINPFQSTE